MKVEGDYGYALYKSMYDSMYILPLRYGAGIGMVWLHLIWQDIHNEMKHMTVDSGKLKAES